MYFFSLKLDIIQFRIIKRHNCDELFRYYSQNEQKTPINWTINAKNYMVLCRAVYRLFS